MGGWKKQALQVDFSARLCLVFHGASVSSDGNLPAHREIDKMLGLTAAAAASPPTVRARSRTATTGSCVESFQATLDAPGCLYPRNPGYRSPAQYRKEQLKSVA